MITEIFIEGKQLDISADISSLLTFAIDDVKDFASRQTSFSKTVVLPGTAKNNAIFGNIFEIGQANAYSNVIDNIGYNFNASKSAKCLIFQDNLQTFKGTLRLLQINKDKKHIDYEVALNGELTSLNVILSSKYLTDLDFSAYNIPYSVANIVASWNNPGGSGLYFPLADYGTYSTLKHDWDYLTFRPALYAKEYIDKMFSAASFRYTCPLFNTARFKSFIIPHNQKRLTKLGSSLLSASHTGDTLIAFGDVGSSSQEYYVFETLSSSVFTASAGNTVFTYTDAAPLTVQLKIELRGVFYASDTNFTVEIFKNADIIPLATDIVGGGMGVGYTILFNEVVAMVTGDYFTIRVSNPGSSSDYHALYSDFGTFSVGTSSNVPLPILLGDPIDVNQTLPQNIRQVDFLVSIVKLFNLYVYEDRFDERLIHISPFVDFYSVDSANSIDWTYKLNRDQPIKVKPLSELNSKIYDFNYKDDSDYYNDLYKKRYNQGYGSYTYDSEFEFASQTNKLELIFAATPLVGYTGEDKVYSTIFKRSGSVEESIDSVIRILQTKKIDGVTSWDIKNGATVLISLTKYGYAGHFDDPDAPDNDLNFGVLKELFFALITGNLTKTQFNIYWSSYMAEITDKDSKMLIAKFYLTAKDIFDLDFSKYVFLDGVLFRLNKITDYNATIPSDCEVQLLNVINTSYSFPPTPGDGEPGPGEDTNYILWNDGEILLHEDGEKLLHG